MKWQKCIEACAYDVYFGTEEDALEMIGTTQSNVLPIPHDLEEDVRYFWRVDATFEGETSIGDIWTFKAGTHSMGCNLTLALEDLK